MTSICMIYYTSNTNNGENEMNGKRLVLKETAHYHCVSRIRGQDMLLKDDEKRRLWNLVKRVEGFSGVEVKTYCLMDNHFHMILKVPKWREVDDKELVDRMRSLYGDQKTDMRVASWDLWAKKGDTEKVNAEKTALKKRMFNLSDFFKTMKERFTKEFNHRTGCEGTLWSERFQSVLLAPEKNVLTTVGTYADSNPVRSGVVKKAEDYVFSGFGAASRGDQSAREGIRDLVNPATSPHERKTGVDEAFAEYKTILHRKHPHNTTKNKSLTQPPTVEFDKSTVDYLAGAAIGSLKFIAKVAIFVVAAPFILQSNAYNAGRGMADEFYRARRINKRNFN